MNKSTSKSNPPQKQPSQGPSPPGDPTAGGGAPTPRYRNIENCTASEMRAPRHIQMPQTLEIYLLQNCRKYGKVNETIHPNYGKGIFALCGMDFFW